MVNTLTFQEGSEVIIDAEVETFDAGWTPSYVSVVRTGPAVQLHIEAGYDAAAAATVATLPAEYAPGDTVTSPDGRFTLAADGALSFTGDTTAAGTAVAQLNYTAGVASP